jgi:hypothetical protein
MFIALLLGGCTFSQLDRRDADAERDRIEFRMQCTGDCALEVNHDKSDDEDRGRTKTDAEASVP